MFLCLLDSLINHSVNEKNVTQGTPNDGLYTLIVTLFSHLMVI